MGPDPLELWHNYLYWYERNISFDNENQFETILGKCLSIYEYDERYKQDVRMVKLWIKYVSNMNINNFYFILINLVGKLIIFI